MPVVWTGVEYFRSELYYLKFSWFNIGYALPVQLSGWRWIHLGMYGVGFLVLCLASLFTFRISRAQKKITCIEILLFVALVWIFVSLSMGDFGSARKPSPTLVGVQMKFPGENLLPKMLDKALAKKIPTRRFSS